MNTKLSPNEFAKELGISTRTLSRVIGVNGVPAPFARRTTAACPQYKYQEQKTTLHHTFC